MGLRRVPRRTVRTFTVAAFASAAVAVAVPGAHSASASFDVGFGSGPNPGVIQLDGGANEQPEAVLGLADGSSLIEFSTGTNGFLRKLTPSGATDTSFGDPSTPGRVQLPLGIGGASAPASEPSIALDTLGRILVAGHAGTTPSPSVVRYSASGVPDATFNGSTPASADGRLVEVSATRIVEQDSTGCLMALRADNGTPDLTFNGGAPACLTGVSVVRAAGVLRTDGTYGEYAIILMPLNTYELIAADVSHSGVVTQYPPIVLPAGDNPTALVGRSDGTFEVSEGAIQRLTSAVLRLHSDGSFDTSWAADGPTPGRLSLTRYPADRMKILPDGRTLLLSRPLVIGGAAELLTDDGRRDGALDPTRPLDLMQLPHGTYSQWTVGSSVINDASMSGSKLIMIGQEFDQFGFGLLHQAAVVLRTDSIVPSAPMSGTAFVTTSGYQPVVPERVLDTRPESQVGYSGPKPAAGSVVEVTVTGAGQPALPANATAVVLNVTGTGATADGFVTVWPCGFQRPLAANLNLVANGTRPNLVVVKIGAGGKVCLYTQTGTHLVADVNGWYRASSSFVPVVPERLLDTRPATQIGYHGASPAAGTTVQLQVTGVGISNIPANAAAIVLNVTATNVSTDGFVTVWPCGTQRPDTASVTTQRGLTAPNLVISLLGNGGTLCLNTLTAADLIADVSGYFTAGGEFTPVQPGRTLDTRSGFRYTGPTPGPGQTVEFAPGLPLLSPSFDEATAVVLNITGVAPGADGFVTVWPCGTPRPLAANLNLSSGSITPNLVIVSLRASGTVCIYTQSGADFVADMFGYFT